MMKKSRTHAAVSFALGVLLLTAGFVLLFMPGPGAPLIIFGLALIATHSKRLSDLLDRAEPALRHFGERLATEWKAQPKRNKAALVTSGLVLASLFCIATWKLVVAAYVL